MTNSKKASRSQKKSAKELLRLGIKAHAYRKDLLENEKSRSLEKALEELQDLLKPKQVLLSELCLLYTSPSPRDRQKSRMPSSA